MPCDQQAVEELLTLLSQASVPRRITILRQVTDMFLSFAGSYSDEQVDLFDAILVTLSQDMDGQILIELSRQLAFAVKAPPRTVSRLSSNHNVDIARPLLQNYKAFADDDLARLAKSKGPDHLLAIADRPQLSEVVTDALLERKFSAVVRKIVANDRARLSLVGYAKVINAAKQDRQLAEIVAERSDIPDELRPFLDLARART